MRIIIKLQIITIAMLLFVIEISAQGILVTPSRIVFEGNQRQQEINIFNSSDRQATYEVRFINYTMTETGEFVEIHEETEQQMFSEPFLRIFPRQVTLGPRQSQTIRLQVRKPSKLEEGEYRSHLYFRSVEQAEPLRTSDADTTALAFQLTPIIGVSIPVIVRHGDELKAEARVESLRLNLENPDAPVLEIAFARNGEISAYGNITVFHEAEGRNIRLGVANGVAIYTPNDRRHFSLPLNVAPDLLNSGTLRVIYDYNVNARTKKGERTEKVIDLAEIQR